MLYSAMRNVAFRADPELVHNSMLRMVRHFPRSCAFMVPGVKLKKGQEGRYHIVSKNLDWSFPVGIAAGFDKNGEAAPYLGHLGFGAVEVGTVTRFPDGGNLRPRIFHYPQWESSRNIVGFPNKGIDSVLERVRLSRLNRGVGKGPAIGINIGVNKERMNDLSFEDYRVMFQTFAPLVDYMVINVSSPNTEGLRKWQNEERLSTLLSALSDLRRKTPIPLFVKIAPELSERELKDVVEISKRYEISGLVATNTVIKLGLGPGGVSGKLLYQKASKVRKTLLEMTKECPDMDVIGVGGFFNFEQILEFWQMGGRFVQVYTSFVYKGPSFLREVQRGIDNLLQKNGVSTLQAYFEMK